MSKMSENEKVAVKLSKLLVDLTVDLEQVGIYIARLHPNTVGRRLQVIAESAEFEKEQINSRVGINPLF